MPKVSAVEKRIYEVEGFEVDITKDGRNVRDDLLLPKQYEALRMSKNAMTVSEWRDKLFKQYPGFEIIVYSADGKKVRGQTKLSTVRDTCLDGND